MHDTITRCRSCGSPSLRTFLSLGEMPLADGLVTKEHLNDPEATYLLTVAFCDRCSLVQILETVPAGVLFADDYPYFSSFSDELLNHSRSNAEELIASRRLGSESLVVELASNDGYLLQYFAQRGVPVLGIDPAPGPAATARARGIPTRCEFFDRDLASALVADGVKADVIVANNVLAHVPDQNDFVAGIAHLLKDDGQVVIEAPYVKDLIDHNEFDTIYHEHHCYFSVTSASALLERHGLHLNDVRHLPIHGGSLRLYAGKNAEPSQATKQYLQDERDSGLTSVEYYTTFADRVDSVRHRLTNLLDDLVSEGKRVAAYGAAAKGATLLNYTKVGGQYLEYVVDRNVHKQGRFMPGVHLPIAAPERLLEDAPEYLLLLAWNFKDEIMAQQQEYARRGGRFIVPVPNPVIV